MQRRGVLLVAWGSFGGMAVFPLFLYATRGDPTNLIWLPYVAAFFAWLGVLVAGAVQISRLRYGFWMDAATPGILEVGGPAMAGLVVSVIGGLTVFAAFGESADRLTFVAAASALSILPAFAVLVWADRQQKKMWGGVRVRFLRSTAGETIGAMREAFAAKLVGNRFDENAVFVPPLRASVFSFPPSLAKLAIRRVPFGTCAVYKLVPGVSDLGGFEQVVEDTLGSLDACGAQSL